MHKARPALLVSLALALALGAAPPLPAEETVAKRPVDDVIRLWNAKLSEDFIRRHVKGTGKVYDLSVDEIVRCREAGIPESLIDAMLATRPKPPEPPAAPQPGPAASPAVVAAPPPAVVVAPAPGAAPAPALPVAVTPPSSAAVPVPTPPPTAPAPAAEPSASPTPSPEPPPVSVPAAPRRWEALVRRNPGVVLFKSAWDAGTLELRGESLRWSDAADPSKNLLIPLGALTEHFLACVEGRGSSDCFEWGFRTRDDVYRFRDAAWADGRTEKVEDIYASMKKAAPTLKAATVPVKGK